MLRSEPVLRTIAEKRNPGKILFNHTVTHFEDIGDSVTVYVTTAGGEESVYQAKYVVGADGGKTVGAKLGIRMDGIRNLRRVVSTHFRADVSKYWDDRTGITHFCNPTLGLAMRSGSMLPLGPTWGRFSEEWQMHFAIGMDDPLFPCEDAVVRIRELLKLPDLEVEVLSLSNWVLERVHATEYQHGRIFVAGDSAHRHPPTTGLGLNTAIQDAHNIAWKLAYVLGGRATKVLLDTYHMERQPVGKDVCDWALFTSSCHAAISAAIGLKPQQPEANVAHFMNLFDETSDTGKAALSYLQYVINGQKVEFGAHEMDLGLFYNEGSFVQDGSPAPPRDPQHQIYTPTTRPGHRLPHAWLELNGKMLSTHDLIGEKGDFLIIADRDGTHLIDTARKAAKARGVTLRVAQIVRPLDLPCDGEYIDLELQWTESKGYSKDGGILVRPDNVIAWRGHDKSAMAQIPYAFEKILGRETPQQPYGVISNGIHN